MTINSEMWFCVSGQPVFAVAGFWKQVGDHRAFTIVTCGPNELVAPIHPKAVITILAEADCDKWLTCSYDEVIQQQQSYPAGKTAPRGPVFTMRTPLTRESELDSVRQPSRDVSALGPAKD